MISSAFAKFFDIIMFLLVVTILLSWFPTINWYKEPFKTLRAFSEIFLSPFRRLIPPIGMIDISPIIAFICLKFLAKAIVNLLQSFGL